MASTLLSLACLVTVAAAAPTAKVAYASSHYGNPAVGPCLPDESKMGITDVPGSFCSPSCSNQDPCPTDVPQGTGTQAQPDCALSGAGSKTPNNCVLDCDALGSGRGGCPQGAQCQPVGQGHRGKQGVCTYPDNGPSPPGPPGPPSPPSPPSAGVCATLNQYLPTFCQCRDVTDGAKVLCTTTVLNQNLQMSLLVAPCAEPATIKFEIEVDGCPWDYSVSAGDKGSEPIPGLDWNYVAVEFGAVLDYQLDGNANALKIDLALDACGSVLGYQRCMSYELPSDFPISILDATINFGECAAKNTIGYFNATRV